MLGMRFLLVLVVTLARFSAAHASFYRRADYGPDGIAGHPHLTINEYKGPADACQNFLDNAEVANVRCLVFRAFV